MRILRQLLLWCAVALASMSIVDGWMSPSHALTRDQQRLIFGGAAPSWLPRAAGVLPTYFADFANNHFWAGGVSYPTLAAWLTATAGSFARSSTAWDYNSNAYLANIIRIDSTNGATLEEARTQYLTSPAAFATQSKSLTAGNYVLFVKGTGSVTLSGGPTGTATEGSPVSFNLASTTTVTFTLSGAVTWANCQNQLYPTTPILAAAAGTVRQADVLLFTPSLGSAFSIVIKAVVPDGTDNAGGNSNQTLFDLTGTNTLQLYRDRAANAFSAIVNDGTTSIMSAQPVGASTPIKVAFRAQAQNFALVANGDSADMATNTVRNMPSFSLGRIGRGNGVQGWNKTIASVVIYPVALSNSDLIIQSTWPGAGAMWGDSLVSGTGASSPAAKLPAVLGTLFSPPRDIYNGGVAGQTSTQIAARQLADTTYRSRIQYFFGIAEHDFNDPTTVLVNVAKMTANSPNGEFILGSTLNSELQGSGTSDYTAITYLNGQYASIYPANKYIDARAALATAVNPSDPTNPVDVLDRANDIPIFTYRAKSSGTFGGAISPGTTAFTSSIALSPGWILQAGSEYIYILAASGTSVTNCTRGYAGTTAGSYLSGSAFTATDPLHLGDPGQAFVANLFYAQTIANGGWNFLLKRDVDPASNDNSPMWLNKAA